MINLDILEKGFSTEFDNAPFDHVVIDNFLDRKTLDGIVDEFPEFSSSDFLEYRNSLEEKKTLNAWYLMPKTTYSLFQYLNSPSFVDKLSSLFGQPLFADSGLHGGGWHVHADGGNLNPHLDYSIHPKLGLQRLVNIIIYVSPNIRECHGGHLGFWGHNDQENCPGALVKEVAPLFNRAVIFNTSQNSWHGMSRPLTLPKTVFRQSLAIYYLCEPMDSARTNDRALFAPRQDQLEDQEIKKLIKARTSSATSASVYRKD